MEFAAIIVFMSAVWFGVGLACGWAGILAVKICLGVFVNVVLIGYGLYYFGIMELNLFAINMMVQAKTHPNVWGIIFKIPYAVAFVAGVATGRRYL